MKTVLACIILLTLGFISCSDTDSIPTETDISGKLDQTFNYPDGFTLFSDPDQNGDKGVETAIQPDGKIVVMGYTYDGVKNSILVLRYNTDGTLDNTFGTNGYVIFDGGGVDQKGLGLALTMDGAIIVTGYIKLQNHRDLLVLKYLPDGVLNKTYSYSSGGEYTDIGFGADVRADGKIIVVGEQSNGENQDVLLVGLTADLEADTDFGDGGIVTYNGTGNENDKGFAVAVQDDGKIVVSGAHIVKGREKEDVLVLRFCSDGSLDTDFGNGGAFTYAHQGDQADYGNFVALQPNGKIVVAGSSYDGEHFKILLLRLNEKGLLDDGFGTGGAVIYQGQTSVFDYAFGVVIQQNGKIVVAGTSNNGENDDAIVLRYLSNGIPDTGFSERGVFTFNSIADNKDQAYGIAIQPDGKIVVTGYSHNGEKDNALTFRLM